MKYLLLICFIFTCNISFANLYLQTEYQEGRKPKIVTKQHIFLDRRYPIYYTKKSYVLILKKINGDEATIESESYNVDKRGHKTMQGGSFGTYKVGKSFTLTDHAPNGDQLFSLKVVLEKIVPARP
ncbi:MAG: hypothetical protein PHY93_04730 [Bacteriovorax sp.]|nr:hypothetical protein [Bacteriovorax sp.]